MVGRGWALLWVGLVGCVEDTGPLRPGSILGGAADAGRPGVIPGAPDVGAPVRRDAGFPVPATEPVYVHGERILYAYDPTRGRVREIGPFSVSLTDIAIDGQGRIMGVDGEWLYEVDPRTGRANEWVRFEQEDFFTAGLTFLPDGRLVVASDGLRVVNVDTGQIEEVLVAPGRYLTSGDLVALPDGFVYWSVLGMESDGRDRLLRVNPRTGEVRDLGSLGFEPVWGLGWADDVFYGFTSAGSRLDIRVVDDAVSFEAQPLSDDAWWGATTNPVRWND